MEHISTTPIVPSSQLEEMETQVLASKLSKARGLLIVDASCNQALKGGNESDYVIISFKRCKASQAHVHVNKRKTRNNVQRQVELEPRSCT